MPAGYLGRIGIVSAGLLAVAAGCQVQPAVSTLPAPKFQAPIVASTSGRLPPPQTLAPMPPETLNGIPRTWMPATKSRKWSWIVIHHTATPAGGMAKIDAAHRAKGWDGVGYDFVIGNGTDTRDGQVEVGYRWTRQLDGAHTKSEDNRFNKGGIGIVMVGNFDETRPSAKQMEACAKLVAYLMKTYRIPADRVMGHKNTGRATDCPGSHTNIAAIRQMAVKDLADAGEAIPQESSYAAGPGGELLRDVSPGTPRHYPAD